MRGFGDAAHTTLYVWTRGDLAQQKDVLKHYRIVEALLSRTCDLIICKSES